jgi:competence protein ComEC
MKKYFKIYLLILLVIANVLIFSLAHERSQHELTVAFLDVGQGDAIFIETPSGRQMLIDGGLPGGAVLRELGKVMPFYDRSIDVILATHADQDHIGGLNDVLNRYSVNLFVRTMTTSTSAVFESLLATAEKKKIKQEIITAPENVDFGDGSHFDILFPDEDTSGWETNESSIVGKMIYGDSSFLLTGDSPILIEKYLVEKYGPVLKSDVLKAGHHGSKYSSSELYVETVSPAYSVISAGLNNSYGHPTQEVLDILAKYKSKIAETLGKGSVIFKSNGQTIILLKNASGSATALDGEVF